MFCCTLLYVHSSIAIILMGKRELIALLNLSSWCLVMVERLFLAVPRGCLQFVIVVFPDHTHLLFSVILFDLHSGKKSESNQHILKDDFRRLQSRYKNYQQVYTNGSKEDSKIGCAVISDNHSNMQRITDDSSIFTAEAKAVDLALDFISTCDINNKLIIFLKAMNHTSSKKSQI